jgi:hypothetical protein
VDGFLLQAKNQRRARLVVRGAGIVTAGLGIGLAVGTQFDPELSRDEKEFWAVYGGGMLGAIGASPTTTGSTR